MTRIEDTGVTYVDTEGPKIFALDGLAGGISYWGYAGLVRLRIGDEIQALASRARSYGSLEILLRVFATISMPSSADIRGYLGRIEDLGFTLPAMKMSRAFVFLSYSW